MNPQIVHVALLIYTKEDGHTKPVVRQAELNHEQAQSVLNFVRHRLHGGRIRLLRLPNEQPKIIVPP